MGMARQSISGVVPVLLTRPEAEAQAFATALTDRFGGRVRPLLTPLMAVEYLAPSLPEGHFVGAVFTSASGVEGASRLRASLPGRAWCVGAKTAARAQAAGFEARSANGDADALVASILADPPGGRLLHLRGQEAQGEVAERLNSAGIETESAIVYRQLPQLLRAEGVEILRRPGIVLVPLFSPRSARLFAAALPARFAAELHLVVMSAAVAMAAEDVACASIEIAERPDAAAMVEAVARVLA